MSAAFLRPAKPADSPIQRRRDSNKPSDRSQFLQTRIDQSRAFGDSGIRKILKPAISGNQSAASGDTNVKTAAGTSPLISRSIALVCPSLSCTSAAPAAAIAIRTLPLDADCLSSIAMSLLARSDTDLISRRAMRSATRLLLLFGDADAIFSASLRATVSERSERSVLFDFCSGAGAIVAAVTCSASAVAAATCSCIVLVLELAAALALSGGASDLAAALSAGCNAATLALGISRGIGTACFAMRAGAAGFNLL